MYELTLQSARVDTWVEHHLVDFGYAEEPGGQ